MLMSIYIQVVKRFMQVYVGVGVGVSVDVKMMTCWVDAVNGR